MPSNGSIGLFTREIRAIFDGTMSSVLRPIDPQPFINHDGDLIWKRRSYANMNEILIDGPYAPGDMLRVKEMVFVSPASRPVKTGNAIDTAGRQRIVGYVADMDEAQIDTMVRMGASRKTWTNMPRWASRFGLVITSSRILRLHDLTGADAAALGFVDENDAPCPDGLKAHWDAEFSARMLGWPVNPWVRLDSICPTFFKAGEEAAVITGRAPTEE